MRAPVYPFRPKIMHGRKATTSTSLLICLGLPRLAGASTKSSASGVQEPLPYCWGSAQECSIAFHCTNATSFSRACETQIQRVAMGYASHHVIPPLSSQPMSQETLKP